MNKNRQYKNINFENAQKFIRNYLKGLENYLGEFLKKSKELKELRVIKNSILFLDKGYTFIIKYENPENKQENRYFYVYKNGEFVKIESIPKPGYFVNVVKKDYLIIPINNETLVLKDLKNDQEYKIEEDLYMENIVKIPFSFEIIPDIEVNKNKEGFTIKYKGETIKGDKLLDFLIWDRNKHFLTFYNVTNGKDNYLTIVEREGNDFIDIKTYKTDKRIKEIFVFPAYGVNREYNPKENLEHYNLVLRGHILNVVKENGKRSTLYYNLKEAFPIASLLKRQKKLYNKKRTDKITETQKTYKGSYFKLGDIIKKQKNDF